MALVRVIPIVLYRGTQAVITTGFGKPRPVGSVINLARLHASRQVDELVFLDIGGGRGGEPDFNVVRSFAKELNCPFAVGGAIRSIDDVARLLEIGADRVVIESKYDAITATAARYGKQAVIGSAVYGLNFNQVIDLHLHRLLDAGVGELLVQSELDDGRMLGFCIPAIVEARRIAGDTSIIAASGLGSVKHAIAAVNAGANAVAGAAIFQFTDITPLDIARGLALHGIEARV